MKKDNQKVRVLPYAVLKSDRPIEKIARTDLKRSAGMVIFNKLRASFIKK